MKQLYLFIILISIGFTNIRSETAEDSWIAIWQKCTVALGKIDSVEIQLTNNVIQKKAYFKVLGSGAIFYVKKDSIVIPTLVTAKHVFHNPDKNWYPDSLKIRFSWFENEPIDEYFGISIVLKDSVNKFWYDHPDTLVDLVCYPLLLDEDIGIKAFPILPYNLFAKEDDIFQGAGVMVLGYPGSVGKEFWTKALLRDGIISWTAPTNPDLNKILIDCDIFPGNSGGPVFLKPSGFDKKGNFTLGSKVKFLGIVTERRFSSTPVRAKGINEIKLGPRGLTIYSLESMGIGVIEPAPRVRQLLSAFQNAIN